MRDAYIYVCISTTNVLELIEACYILYSITMMNRSVSSKFRLPPVIEEETDEIYASIKKKFSRINHTKILLKGILMRTNSFLC